MTEAGRGKLGKIIIQLHYLRDPDWRYNCYAGGVPKQIIWINASSNIGDKRETFLLICWMPVAVKPTFSALLSM
jgi:hypothetical protein